MSLFVNQHIVVVDSKIDYVHHNILNINCHISVPLKLVCIDLRKNRCLRKKYSQRMLNCLKIHVAT